MTTETAIQPVHQVKQALASPGVTEQFRNSLPRHIDPEKFKAAILTAINLNPQLARAATTDMKSLLVAASRAAQDGLMPDGRDAAFVVFGQAVQYMPMIGGILRKIRNSGELASIDAQVVYEHDEFDYALGDEPYIKHKPILRGERGEPIAVYATATLKDGSRYREVMSVAEVERVRAVSRSAKNGPWVQWWSEMARKTAIRRLAKRLPMDTDVQEFFDRDAANDGVDFTAETAPRPSQVTRLRDRVLKAARHQPDSEPADVIDEPAVDPKTAAKVKATDDIRDGTMEPGEAVAYLVGAGFTEGEANRVVEAALEGDA